ncbi:MAG: hypothetical protein HC836_21965 [Richelia sp. RM2_1_2]|nr:hypothetical protein [Richelia sp. SM2_1_7]NJM18852.1 hypothetical protein [Richelia sp. SM1_7_0]NJN10325.1 hypothetical protein [Richelia sp. RM1_1_1]NJO28123.1 hypothetical protein [Richelia sp. SL_2_1]NJO60823.1 hypothetical protein [Richelia sp. RM2_1_2]
MNDLRQILALSGAVIQLVQERNFIPDSYLQRDFLVVFGVSVGCKRLCLTRVYLNHRRCGSDCHYSNATAHAGFFSADLNTIPAPTLQNHHIRF